jgi:hypothetical protein
MSAEKRSYVSPEEQELQRLRRQESRLRSLQEDLPEQMNAIREQSRQELQQRMKPLEERAQRQEKENQKLKSNLKDLEVNTKKNLQKQQQEFQASIANVKTEQKNQRAEYLNLIDQQNQKFEQYKQEQRNFQKEVNQKIKEFEADQQRKAELAENFLADLETIYNNIDREYQHQRFAPGRLEDLKRGVDLARNNFQNGVTEAAIAQAQETYLHLADLRLELIQKEQEWELLYNAALSDVQSLITEAQGNRKCEVAVGAGEEAGEEQKFKLEVDYWVEGRLTAYEEQLQGIATQLENGEKTLSTAEVKQIGEKIKQLEPSLEQLVEEAKLNIISSQLRVEIADGVVEALSAAGFTLENPEQNATYEGNDQRGRYVVKVKNVAGDEVVTVITPEQEFGKNSVSINTFSETVIDEKATQQNAKAVFDLLAEEGIQAIGQLECENNSRQDYQNLQAVKNRQTESQARQQKRAT